MLKEGHQLPIMYCICLTPHLAQQWLAWRDPVNSTLPCTSKANTGLTPQVQVTQTVGAEPNAQRCGGEGRVGKEATHHQSDTKLGDSHDLMMRAFCTLGPTVLSNSTASCRSRANSSGLSVYSGFKEATSLSTVARRGGTCNHHIDHNLFNPPLVHSHLQGGTCNCHIDHNLFNPQLVHCPLYRWYLQQSFQVTTWLTPSLQEVTSGHHW